ncbi:hypothetical protein BGZ50_001232, partial [Haplosporangium sp. Z 11]
MRTVFTASIQSTQWVEKTHHLIKMVGITSSMPLAGVLKATSARVEREFAHATSIEDAASKRTNAVKEYHNSCPEVVTLTFHQVLKEYTAMLGIYANSQMKTEMMWSFYFRSTTSNLELVQQQHMTGQATNLRESSLATLVSRLGRSQVTEAFSISDKTSREQQEYVVLLTDHS